MDARRKRLTGLLSCLGVVVAASLVWAFWPSGRSQATPSRRGAVARANAGEGITVADVRLGALEEARTAPSEGGRNPFRFRPPAPPPPPPQRMPTAGAGTQPGVPGEPVAPPPPPPPPPIPYKFIGILAGPGQIGRLAVLSDGKLVWHGREGDIIEGRFKLLKIGEESVQMEYIDGRGRQTIRLSGS